MQKLREGLFVTIVCLPVAVCSNSRKASSTDKGSQYELWSEPLQDKGTAMREARNATRDYLACQAELYSASANEKRPDHEIVRVTMDDGWSVAIGAAEKNHARESVENLFRRMEKGGLSAHKGKSKDWPSR